MSSTADPIPPRQDSGSEAGVEATPAAPARAAAGRAVSAPATLDVDEVQVARAVRRVYHLVDQLITTPIHPAVYSEFRDYLDTEAGPAVAAYEALLRRPVDQLADRVAELLGRPAAAEGTLR